GRYDVVFRRKNASTPPLAFGFPSLEERPNRESQTYVTDPIYGVMTQALVSELRAYLQTRLPPFMLPASSVLLDRLPQTPSGKVDGKALPGPDAVPSAAAGHQAPRSRTERRLAAIWADVLNIGRVSVSDNFFAIGGHSLLATQLVSRILVEFGIEMPVRMVFEAPTIAALALKLDQQISKGGREPDREHVIARASRERAAGNGAADQSAS